MIFNRTLLKELIREPQQRKSLFRTNCKVNGKVYKVIDNNNVIKKRKSNFYQILNNYPKIDKASFSIVDSNKTKRTEERFVNKIDFKEFILESNELEPLDEQEAIAVSRTV